MKVCSFFTCLSLLAASSASAQLGVNFNENPPYDPSLEVSGQDGWTINPGTPSDLSYFQQVGSENWGSLGGLYATPAGSSATLSKPVGVPFAGVYEERLNTDSEHYGGKNIGTPLGLAHSEKKAAHGKHHSIVVRVPPLATIFLTCQSVFNAQPAE